jgi:hypothetical protein
MIASLVFVQIASEESPKEGSWEPEIGMHRESRSTNPHQNLHDTRHCVALTWTRTTDSDLRELSDGPSDRKPQDD